LAASLSACHQLWYLALCARAGICVLSYEDEVEGTMLEEAAGGGHFTHVRLKPKITLRAGDDVDLALRCITRRTPSAISQTP